ncbi:lipopolysaccharide biosynthesis protein [Mycobacterium antarcticum]|uniref:lipopolysaccharide biosynthesis protein n=1 Tax=unclassified Mycolicibacterium TaxID=2636767 RepID=UPI0024E19808|nr:MULTISPECIES: teichoic acid transporter [unclassified Mycolicibacterium]
MSTDEGANSEVRRSFGWRAFAAVGGMATTFLLSVIVVRSLDLQEAAAFFAILASISLGPLVGRLGLGYNVIRLMGAESDALRRRQIAATHLHATALLSVLSAPFIALIGCVALIGHSDFVPVMVMTALLIAVESTRLILSDIFAATGRVRASVATMHYARNMAALPLVALVVLIAHRPSLLAVIATYCAVSATQVVIALVHARHEVSIFRFSSGVATLRTTIGQGTKLFSLDFSEFMLRQGMVWLATAAFSSLAATQFSATATLATQVTLLDSLFALAVAPTAARLWAAGQKSRVIRILSDAATMNTLIAIVVLTVVATLGPFVLEVAYGPEMRTASSLLLILTAAGAFQACFDGSITLLVISGNITAASRTAVAVLAVALPCACVAAWMGGPIALAVVVLASIATKSICMWLVARKVVGVAPCAHLNPIRAFRQLTSDRDDVAETRATA